MAEEVAAETVKRKVPPKKKAPEPFLPVSEAPQPDAPPTKKVRKMALGEKCTCLDELTRDYLMIALDDSIDAEERNKKRAEKFYDKMVEVDPEGFFGMRQEDFVKPFTNVVDQLSKLKDAVEAIDVC